MGSSRLPGKVLRQLEDKTIIEQIYYRTSQAKHVSKVIVATPFTAEDRILVNFLSSKGISVFVGSEENVLERFLQASKFYGADNVVRVTGDNPLTCPRCIDIMVESHIEGKADYTYMNGLPLGTASEVISYQTLAEVSKKAFEGYQKEHVTIYIRENKEQFIYNEIEAPVELSFNARLSVDTDVDYQLVKLIYRDLYKVNGIIELSDVISWLRNNKEWALLNSHISQKVR